MKGTIITAKPSVMTSDGIILKPHEKLPSQLLNEFCQQKKRPNPKYFTQPPHHRFLLKLEDPKNPKNDLSFCPEQSFESDKIAKDYSALLALWHFQKALPLENKLPEPYSTSWRAMFDKEKEEIKLEKVLPMKFDSFYVSLLSEKYKNGKMNFIKAFWIGLVSNWKANRSLEFSSHIYVLKNNQKAV